MGELLRSQDMELVQLFIEMEAAPDSVDELGRLGLMQFRDLNPDVNAFQRNFVHEVKRADEMERKLRFFEEQTKKAGIPTVERDIDIHTLNRNSGAAMDELEVQLEELERELVQLNTSQETLERNENELIEMQHVLTKNAMYLGGASSGAEGADVENAMLRSPLLGGGADAGVDGKGGDAARSSGFVTGVLLRDKLNTFTRVLWRALRGNLFLKHAEIDELIKDPNSGELVEKSVFIIFYKGRNSGNKITKLCEAFGANLYPCPDSAAQTEELGVQVRQRLADLRTVLERSTVHRQQRLRTISENLELWKCQVLREKSIYHTMNLFDYDVGRKCLIAEGWCPRESTEQVQLALRAAYERSGAEIPSIAQPKASTLTMPTYFKTNKYTEVFQDIIDAYGIARYTEINPTVFSIITFPFLFGVMFGDVGHGSLLLLMSLAFIFFEKQLQRGKMFEMLEICFNGRYMLLLMSLFSIYNGFLYNECFAIPMQLFSSNWQYETMEKGALAVRNSEHYAYPFGVDPIWKGAENELDFYNSLKMKMSVLLGVIQMCLGIILSLFNGVHFRKPYNIIFEFIPQILFMGLIFGYMDFLIIYKWLKDWSVGPYPPTADHQVPRLLNVMIQMFLSPWTVPEEYELFPGQVYIQLAIILVAVVCVPMMLFPKPYLLKWEHEKKMRAQQPANYMPVDGSNVMGDEEADEDDEHGEEFDFSEVFTHQAIHTIEFVLGCVSNTASYLRLWALSLAHSELATVFWEMTIGFILDSKIANGFTLFIAWGAWAGATVGILLGMESLSAFLHALRLHWVEFQNKFYAGDGHKFAPFSYKRIFSGEDETINAME
eukprot:TRINITY_DN570_c1_g1_i1.p1 TRINITY_DN570_c1_g1~~TRINITY_DN570_c1_g1_i1.p1  ORF type:complete len:834 (-),score=357.09 TRINITY_DN570_c1_g1_i1:154-2655(-)